MLYTRDILYQKLIVPALLVLFLLLSVVGYGQNNEDCPSCHDCTATAQPIFSQFPYDTIRICAGGDTTIHIGYDLHNDIVIAAQEPRIDSAERMFISESSPNYGICNNGDCTNYSPIIYSGYSGIIDSVNDIKYVRLNIEHALIQDLNINLSCQNGQNRQKASILNFGGSGFTVNSRCVTADIPSGWLISSDDFFQFGEPNPNFTSSDYCDLTLNPPGKGYDYCWSSSTDPTISYASGTNSRVYETPNYDDQFTIIASTGLSQIYKPDQGFENLIGCPINGTWQIEIFDGWANHFNGYLFDWEIVFDDGVLQPAGNSVNGAAVLTADGQVDTNFDVSNFSEGDSTIVFTAPMVTQNDTLTRTLQLYDSTARCWYDREFTVVVMAPEGRKEIRSICMGEKQLLVAECDNGNGKIYQNFDEASAGGDTWHSHSISYPYDGPANSEITSEMNVLSNFPIRSKVFSAGRKVKLGNNNNETGSMKSVPMVLNQPFSVLVRAKGWGSLNTGSSNPKKTKVNVVVDKDMVTQQVQSFETEHPYCWPGTDAYSDYLLPFNGASASSTITVETVNNGGQYDTRAFVDYVETKGVGCTFHWSDGTNNWGNDSIGQTITVSPSQTTTYYVTVTPPGGGCVRVDTFEVRVNQNPDIHISPLSNVCPNVGTVSVTATIQNETQPNYIYTWQSEGLTFTSTNPTSSISSTNTSTATIPDPPSSCGENYSIYVTVTDDNGCIGADTTTISVQDPAAPVITASAEETVNLGCNPTAEQLAAPTFTVNDPCEGNFTLTDVDDSGAQDGTGACEKTRTWTANYTNACDQSATQKVVTYNWKVSESAPVITASTEETVNLGCNPTAEQLAAPTFTVADPCEGTFALNDDHITDSGEQDGSGSCEKTRTWTANYTNACDQSATQKVVTYNWTEDHTPPTVSVLPDFVVIGCDESAKPNPFTDIDALNTAGAGISDECGNVSLEGYQDAPATGTCPITIVRTYTVEDNCGNQSIINQNIIIQIPNEFTITAVDTADTVTCFSMAESSRITLPIVKDACGQNAQLTQESPISSGLDGSCEGIVTYTYNYLNCAGKDTSWTFTYYILLPETIAGVPNDQTRSVSCWEDVIRPQAPSIQDVCDNEITVTFIDSVATIQDNADTVVFRFKYEDCAGNDSIWKYTYIIQPDVFDPFQNDGTSVNCISDIEQPTLPTREVCNNPVTLDFLEYRGGIVNGCGDSIYVYTYTVNGQSHEWLYTYHVSPMDFDMPDNGSTIVECVADAIATNIPLPTVTDYCGRELTPETNVQIDTNLTNNCTGTIVFKYTYKDCANHSHIWMFTYNIQHITPPHQAGEVSTSVSVECLTDAIEPSAEMLPIVVDVCGNEIEDPVPTVNTTWEEGQENCVGTKTYTYKYRDCANLEYEWVFTYNINHVTPPSQDGEVAISADVECVSDAVAPSGTMLPVVKDICGNILEAPVPTSDTIWTESRTNCEGAIIFTYTYTDCDDLEYEWAYTYTIEMPDEIAGVPAAGGTDVPCLVDVAAPPAPVITDICGRT
ncbi:MAG: hypothetical protein IKP54_05240, partial [Bacteroidales bacterium]|nr:hypothetical protein [Bacteroidales bacterium]